MKLNINLLAWQIKVLKATELFRYIVISAGRQSGKTTLCLIKTILFAGKHPDSICWWVSPQFSISKIAFRRAVVFLNQHNLPYTSNKSELTIEFNGSTIWFKSGDNPDALRGETVDFLVIDEMGVIKRDVWELALRGTITVTRAPVIFIGTPKGKNLFYELYVKGLSNDNPDYKSFQFSSNKNKFFSADEWEDVKKLPQRIFEQEYMATFIDDGGEVFRGIRNCIAGELQEPQPGIKYYAGVDLAKTYDYTVVTIINEDKKVVAFDRFNGISWELQKARITQLVNKYNAYALVDSTGVGDPILEDLQKTISCEGFKFSNTSKRQLIESLAIAIEKQEISFPEIPELINELNIFTFDQSPNGTIRYNAPAGLHDDCVISLALAQFKVNKRFIFSGVTADGQVGEIGNLLQNMAMQEMFLNR